MIIIYIQKLHSYYFLSIVIMLWNRYIFRSIIFPSVWIRIFRERNLFDRTIYLAIWGTIPWKGRRRWGEFDVQVRRPGTRPRDILIFERRRRPASVRFRSVHRNQWFRRASGRRKSSCWRRTNVGPRLFRNTSRLTAVFDDFSTIVG